MDNADRKSLLSRLREGDNSAHKEFYDQYHKLIKITAMKVTCNFHDAEEVTSKVLAKFWRGDIKDGNNLKGLVRTMTKHMALDYVRDNKKSRYALEHSKAMEKKAVEPIKIAEQLAAINELLEELDDKERDVFYRYVLLGETFQEIADEMGMTLAATFRTYKRAVKKLTPACEKIYKNIGGDTDE